MICSFNFSREAGVLGGALFYLKGFHVFILCCGFRGEGKLDECFLPTVGRDTDVAHKFVKELSPS